VCQSAINFAVSIFYFLGRLINFNKIWPLEVYQEENWQIKLNVIEEIAEKSPPIRRRLQSVFRHSDHFDYLQIQRKRSHLLSKSFSLQLKFDYVKFHRVARYSRIRPPLSGPDNPVGLPLQRDWAR